jgi:hypothetical protein
MSCDSTEHPKDAETTDSCLRSIGIFGRLSDALETAGWIQSNYTRRKIVKEGAIKKKMSSVSVS